MNRHENLYHRSGRWLVGLFILWVAAIVTFGLLPSNFQNNGVGDPDTAKYVLKVFLSINDQMDDSIRAVESQTSPDEYTAFKRGVGHVMCEVFEQIVGPICKRHPSLRPPEIEA